MKGAGLGWLRAAGKSRCPPRIGEERDLGRRWLDRACGQYVQHVDFSLILLGKQWPIGERQLGVRSKSRTRQARAGVQSR